MNSAPASMAVDQKVDAAALIERMGAAARLAARKLAIASTAQKNQTLRDAADAIDETRDLLLDANAKDLAYARSNRVAEAMLDRLILTPDRITAIAAAVREIADLADPVGQATAAWEQPNGLKFKRVRVPLGVIGIVFESRPNVTADAGALCLKSGNAVILRCGSETLNSAEVLATCLAKACAQNGLPEAAIQLVPTRDREAVGAMISRPDLIDVLIPRGGKSLIKRVMTGQVPVLAHLDGLCHVYVDGAADLDMAERVVVNAKMRRTSVCGSAETLLIDQAIADTALPRLIPALQAAGCAVRGDAAAQAINQQVTAATDEDWTTEYLAPVIAVKVVNGVHDAIDHINRFGSHHTDSIITGDTGAAAQFLTEIDSAIVLHNASTQFADGGEFGFGAEIGIATGRLHARGPVGVEQLTTFKYQVQGSGQIRP